MSAKKAKAARREAGFVKPAKEATPPFMRASLQPRPHQLPNGKYSGGHTQKQLAELKAHGYGNVVSFKPGAEVTTVPLEVPREQ